MADLAQVIEIDHLEPQEVYLVVLVFIVARVLLKFVDILFLLVAHSSLMLLAELLQIVTCEEWCMSLIFLNILSDLLFAVLVHFS